MDSIASPEQPQTSVAKPAGYVPHVGGRPTKLTEEVIGKLIVSFQRGLSVSSACVYAGISRDVYYYQLKNDPVFSNRIDRAKEWGSQLAGDIIADVLLDSQRGKVNPETGKPIDSPKYSEKTRVGTARWYLEKKQPEEFGRTMQIPGAGGNINNSQTNYFFISDADFRTKFIEQGGIKDLSPEDIAQALEAPDVASREAEATTLSLPTEILQSQNATNQDLSRT